MHGLLRCSRAWSSPSRADDRPIELLHLLMSVAMIAMVPMWGGTGAKWVQLLAFGAFCGYFAFRAAHRLLGPSHRRGAAAMGYHLLAAGAMTWMVAAMTPMTGHQWSGGSGGHAGHAGPIGQLGGSGDATPPLWMVVVTTALVIGLVGAALVWVRRAANPLTQTPISTIVAAGGATGGEVSVKSGSRPPLEAQTDYICHALMSAGMATMLLVMI
ncbi:MAG: DUF5134 domain-containing protein [Mycobacteriales bacterium]